MENIVVKISQKKQNFGIEFQCFEKGNLIYKGYDNFISQHFPAKLEDNNGNIIFNYVIDLVKLAKSQIPQSGHSSKNGYISTPNKEKTGKFFQEGYAKNRFYNIDYDDNNFQIYMWSTGHNPHLLVYLNDKQIAQIEKEYITENYLDQYTLYLLGEYEIFKPLFTFFTIWYDKMEYGNQGEAFIGVKNVASIGYSISGIGKDKYNPEFMKQNFPDIEIIDIKPTFDTVKSEIKDQWKDVKERTFNRKNFKNKMLNPLVISICFIGALLFGLVFGFFGHYFGFGIWLGLVVFILAIIGESLMFLFFWLICRKR